MEKSACGKEGEGLVIVLHDPAAVVATIGVFPGEADKPPKEETPRQPGHMTRERILTVLSEIADCTSMLLPADVDLSDPAMRKRLLMVGLQYVGAVLVVAMGITYMIWPTISAYRIHADLNSYAREVRHSDCPLHEKEALLDRIEAIEDLVDATGSIVPLRWSHTDDAIREMLDGEISSDEVRLIERELRRTEKKMLERLEGGTP